MAEPLVLSAIALVGILLAAQAPINGGLARTVGDLPAALVNFLVGAALLFVICLAAGRLPEPGAVSEVPIHALGGGLIGALYVTAATIVVPKIGAGAVASATIAGQLSSSIAVDALGWFGIERQPVTIARLSGAVLLLAGALVVVWFRDRSGPVPIRRPSAAIRLAAAAIIFVIGLLVGVQHPVNSDLAGEVGELGAGLVNFLVGSSVLGMVVIGAGWGRDIGRVTKVSPVYLGGGVVGALVITSSLAAVTVVGATALAAALVTGQLIGSMALDRVGAFGLTRIGITPWRMAGGAMLIAGTLLAVG